MRAIILLLTVCLLMACATPPKPAPVRIEIQGHEVKFGGN